LCKHAFYIVYSVCAGVLLEVNENNGTRREHHQARKDSTEVKVQHEAKLQIKGEREIPPVPPRSNLSQCHEQTHKMTKLENKNQNDVPRPVIAASTVIQRTSGIAPPKSEAQDDRKVSLLKTKAPKMTSASVPVTTAVLPNTIGPKHTETLNVTLPNHTIPKMTGLSAPCVASSVPNNIPPKMTLMEVPTGSTTIQKVPQTSLVLTAATEQSSGKSSVNVPTTKMTRSQDATLFPPSHKPPKTVGLNVTTATKEAFSLRQVHSCPNSLQR